MLARFDLTQRLMISYLTRREKAIVGTLAPFDLRPTGLTPGYQTVQACAKNDIRFYANFDLALAKRCPGADPETAWSDADRDHDHLPDRPSDSSQLRLPGDNVPDLQVATAEDHPTARHRDIRRSPGP